MKTMAVRRVERLFILVYGITGPSDDDFGRFLESLNRCGTSGTMHLVASEGGEPSEDQRARLHAVIGISVPVAILSGSRRYRALVNMKRWFRIPTKAFKMSEVTAALGWLKVPTLWHDQIKVELRRAWRDLG
jgi:hypothetical protein